ncbi:MAG: BamA/TamA family outer membrane protein [Acidobacteria bacterium]|nr:BamA/TamA family outer membrane protein [Acidobacteriota bacterium]
MHFLASIVLLWLCSGLYAQEPTPNPAPPNDIVDLSAVAAEDSSASQPHVRIIDVTKFPKKTPLLGRILLAPFRAIAPKANAGLTFLEENKGLNPLEAILRDPVIHPVFGNLGDGSGFGFGFYASTADKLSKKFSLFTQHRYTTKKYLESAGGMLFKPFPESRLGAQVSLTGTYRLRPEEDFWGIGPNSLKSERSTYNLEERQVGVTVSATVLKNLRAGVGLSYSSNSVFDGKDPRFATTQEVFGQRGLPGLAEGAALLGTSAFLEYEGRDEPSHPRTGAYGNFSVTNNDSVGRGDFGFVNYRLDVRGYVPLGTKRRTLAVRLLGDFNTEKGGSRIPFFRLARLGDQTTLRGYDTYRFHGKNAVLGTAEYRYQLVQGIEALGFVDVGQVFNRRSEFSAANLTATFGGGISFSSSRTTAFKILVAQSPEGARLFFTFGPTF